MSFTNTGSPVDPTQSNGLSDFAIESMAWLRFGFAVIPISPGTKRTAVKWDPWLEALSPESIQAHWAAHPDHEVGFIIGDDFIVFDADTSMAVAALAQIEESFDLTPLLVVKTTRGQHHYFRRSPGTFAKTDSHSTVEHPERIDVKTGRAIVVLPPSTGKEVFNQEVDHANQLCEVGQDCIDAVFHHNGRQPPRQAPVQPDPAPSSPDVDGASSFLCQHLDVLIRPLDPDASYDSWVEIGMILYHETGGSHEGLKIFDSWSARGAKYPGYPDIQSKWQSFGGYAGIPKTVGTLKWMLTKKRLDWQELLAAAEPGFTAVDPIAPEVAQLEPKAKAITATGPEETPETDGACEQGAPDLPADRPHPLAQFSITGSFAHLVQQSRGMEPVLGQVVMRGQYTVVCAPPNCGKTLIMLHLIGEGVEAGRLDPRQVYYINADDHETGMLEKLRLAEEWGIEMLVPGYQKFTAKELPRLLSELTQNGLAPETIVILDTLKKVAETNDKTKLSAFNEFVRPFCTKGGTFIALHHVNKNRDEAGEVVFSGTADLIDDADAAYTMDIVSTDQDAKTQVVAFTRKKGRGGVVANAAFRYSIADHLAYPELLVSVEEVDPDTLEEVRQAEQVKAQEPIIAGIKTCIRDGTTLKMSLIRAVANQLGASQRQVKQVLEDHTGTDPKHHYWIFTKGVRGAMNYSLL